MAKNTYISLEKNSKERVDAVNTIKYTLLLNYKVPELEEENTTFIEHLMEDCQQCCSGLFSDQKVIYYNFFGSSFESDAKPSLPFNLDKYNSEFGFHSMILHHCVLSSYHAILTELLHGQSFCSYDLIKHHKNHKNDKIVGVQTLFQNGNFVFEENKVSYQRKNKNPEVKSGEASTFETKAYRHIKKMPGIMNGLLILKQGTSFGKYPSQFSGLCYHICNQNVSHFNSLKSPKNPSESSKSPSKLLNTIEHLTNLAKCMEPFLVSSSENKLGQIEYRGKFNNPVDTLYHYYLTERLFNFRLFYSLLKNIEQVETNTIYRLNQKETISILDCCKKLPNIFSRQYFLKYAFDQFTVKPLSYINEFWYTQDIRKSSIIIGSARGLRLGFQFPKWLEQYSLFINYMAEFVIPVYEWCFINMLLEAVEQRYPDIKHTECLNKARELLACYMENYYQEIFWPITLSSDKKLRTVISKNMDIVDVISEYKNININNTTIPDIIDQVREDLLSDSSNANLDLNLKPLNPDFFRLYNQGNADSNESRIRKFYIDLVRDTYLEEDLKKMGEG